MKRVWVGVGLALAAAAIVVLVGGPVAKIWVKGRIAEELQSFVREGSVSVGDIALSPKQRLARLRDIRVLDRSGHLVISVDRIDVNVRRIHHRHADASVRISQPAIHVDAACAEDWRNLIRPEAFEEESPLRVDRFDITGGLLEIAAPGFLAESETLAWRASAHLENEEDWQIDLDAHGARSDVGARFEFRSSPDGLRVLPGTGVDLATSNVSFLANRHSANLVPDQIQLHVAPAETAPAPLQAVDWRVTFGSPDVDASFDRIRVGGDTQVVLDIDRFRVRLRDESIECFESRVSPAGSVWEVASERWIRARTGLSIYQVRLVADTGTATLHARIEGFPLDARVQYGSGVRATVSAERMPLDVLMREAGESLPLAGFARLGAEAGMREPDSGVQWRVTMQSPDLRFGSAAGKISMRADVAAEGVDTRIDHIFGTVEPAPGVPISITGKGSTRGVAGRMSLRDRSLKDIRLLAETFGKEVPLIGESGRAALDVDFRVGADLDIVFKGRMRITDAALSARESAFRVEGLECDLPFERSSDTGKLVLDEVPSGSIHMKSLVVGPYAFRDLTVTTKSRGDKWYADLAPMEAFGGAIRAKALFYFSDAPTECDVSVDSVSLREVLEPIPDARRSLSGLLSGVAKLSVRGGDWMRLSGTFWAKATPGQGERTIASRKFLENIGGKAVKKMRFPPYVPYRRGSVRMRFLDGRIFFDEVKLEARSMFRGVRFGRVHGTYRIKDLIDELSNVAGRDFKFEVERRKKR